MINITTKEEFEGRFEKLEVFRLHGETAGQVFMVFLYGGEMDGTILVQYQDGEDGTWTFSDKQAAFEKLFNILISE